MKGVTLFADIVSVLILLAVIMLSTLLVWGLILLRNAEVGMGLSWPRQVALTIFYLPAKYDSTMMAFLEYQPDGIPMKRVLEAAAIQESTSPWIDGKTIDLEGNASSFFSERIGNQFILKIVLPDKELIIVNNDILISTSRPTSLQETSSKLFLLNGEEVDLKLLVRN